MADAQVVMSLSPYISAIPYNFTNNPDLLFHLDDMVDFLDENIPREDSHHDYLPDLEGKNGTVKDRIPVLDKQS